MGKILFSLPVHERPDIVRDQIENINYFCPGSLIAIHVSADATADKDEFRRQCDFENVLINPKSYETVWSGGIMHTHITNFMHAIETGVDFDTVMLISSNELLVKHGLSDYVDRYEIGAQTEVYDSATDWGVFREDILNSEGMQGFLSKLGLPLFFGGQAEGQFATRKIFSSLVRVYTTNFPMGPVGFPIEEVILPTMAARHCMTGTDVTLPITLCDYCTNLAISEDAINLVRSGKGALYAKRVPKALRSPHIGASVLQGVFSVKRIPREDCDLRRFVRSLMT
jgi:hypothetical protein